MTSTIMKCFERLILSHLLPHAQSQLDPYHYQFAYRSRRSTDDAVVCLLHKLLEHMVTVGNYAQTLFIDLVQHLIPYRHVMVDKLQKLEVPASLVHWVLNFLSNRQQCVRVGDIKSQVLVSNSFAPQPSGLCPESFFFYTLYTNDCWSVYPSTMFVRFSDDTASLITIICFFRGTFLQLVQYQLSASRCFQNERNVH